MTAKIILGWFRATRNAVVISDLNFNLLSNRREHHIPMFFYKIKTGLSSPVLHSFLQLTLGEISVYSFDHENTYRIPLSKRSLVHNSFRYKAPVLWNFLPQYIILWSNFAAFKICLTLFHHGKKRSIWHLRGSNPSATSSRCTACSTLVTTLQTLIWRPSDSVQ